MKRAGEFADALLGDCDDIEVRRPRFGGVGSCAFAEHHEFIAQALQKAPCTVRRKVEVIGAARIKFKDDHGAMNSKSSHRSAQNQFFSPLDIYFNNVNAIDAVLLQEIVERFRLDFFAFVAGKWVLAQRIAYWIP